MSEPLEFTQRINAMLEGMLKKKESVSSFLIAATPFSGVFGVSLHGQHAQIFEHRSKDPKIYPVSIPVASMTSGANLYRSQVSVTLGMFRIFDPDEDAPRTWRRWEVVDARVEEDSDTREVAVKFGMLLDGRAVAAGSFSYVADLYIAIS